MDSSTHRRPTPTALFMHAQVPQNTSELDRAHMTASTTTMAKVRTVLESTPHLTHLDTRSRSQRSPHPPAAHGHGPLHTTRPPLQAPHRGFVWLQYTQAKHHTTCPLSAPDRTGATARLGFHRNISVAAAESCELRPHASRCRRRLEGGLRGRQVGRTGPMGSLVAARPAARRPPPAANVRGGRHHHQC